MNKDKVALIRGFITLIVFALLFIPASIWLYNHSAVGNPLCEQMKAQGYYETEFDTAGHESCIDNYKKGECNGVQKFMGIDPKDCYTGSINFTCMDERYKTDEDNLANFGMHCVWGGPGYWAFVASFGIPCMLLAPIFMWFAALWTYYKRNSLRIVRKNKPRTKRFK
jgi:hypothetical protein